MRWWKLFAGCFTVLVTVSLSRAPAQAASQFETSSNVVYSVRADSTTSVTHNIILRNKLPDVYATQYTISVGSTRIGNAWARDGIGFITPTITRESNTTTIALTFNEKSVGLDQLLSFSLGYEDQDIAQKVGRIWEINIPQPEDISEFQDYNVVLIVPGEFSEPVQMIPEPRNHTRQKDVSVFKFEKDALRSRGVTAIFGSQQVFSFDLRYSLKNPSPLRKKVEVALPPDTAYQKVIYENIIPPPAKIEADADGNWMASFSLEGNEEIQIHASGMAIIFLRPTIPVTQVTPPESYLGSQDPWPIDDPTIQRLAQQLKTPENIYRYVVNSLSYNYERVQSGNTRLGAKGVLENPDQAICMEFTDLFIALARAAGIPARELNGFAYTQNPNLRPLSLKKDILHAWPEYYDQERRIWVQVDPTWGDTTQGIDYFSRFDLNHFVFAIHGSNPFVPFPAGFYKLPATQGKDILVEPSDTDPPLDTSLKLVLSLSPLSLTDLSQPAMLRITHTGSTALYNLQVLLESEGFAILTQRDHLFSTFFPFTTYELPLKVRGRYIFDKSVSELIVRINDDLYKTEIEFPPITAYWLVFLTALGLGTTAAWCSLQAGRLLLSLRHR